MPKVFISYSHDSDQHRQRVLELSDRLNTNHIDCDIDQYVNGTPEEGWPLWMEKRLNEADFVLVACTKIYLDRVQRKEKSGIGKGVKWESLLTYQDIYDNDSLNRKFVPIIFNAADAEFVPNPLKPVTHYQLDKDGSYEMLCRYLTGQPLAVKPSPSQKLHLPPKNTSSDQVGAAALSSTHSVLLPQSAPSIVSTPSPKPGYDLRNAAFLVPFRAKREFMVGRDAALTKVRKQLLAGKPTSIGQTALFQGIGGLGKTQLAVEYADHYRDEYPNGVYWITADENIDAQLTRIAVDACWVAPESEHAIKLDVARNRIKTYSDCLIVFDNLESIDAIRNYLPMPSANPHILVTSRREQPDFTDVKLDLLDSDESYLMLVQEAERSPANEEEESAAREIVADLGGLPLALELAGAFLARRPIGWCAYRDLLHENLRQALPAQLASLTKHEADLFKTLSVSEREIGEEPLLVKVLDLLTWSGSAPMSLRLMAHLLDVKPTELYGALGLGKALRLLQEVPDSQRYAVHRLVQEVRRQDRPLAQRIDWASNILQRLGDWFESIRADFRELPVFELEFEHLRAWQIHAGIFSPVASVRLLWLQAYPGYHRGRYEEALRIVQQALAEYEAQDFGITLLKAHLLNDLASCYSELGDNQNALELGKQAFEMRCELLGEKHLDVAMSLNTLGVLYSRLGEFPHALVIHKQSHEMRRELLGDKHPDVASSLSNLANCHYRLGEYPRAVGLGKQALEMRREFLGQKHPDVAISLDNLAAFYSRLGDYQQALELGKQALEMQYELRGDKHPAVAHSLGNLASYNAELGEYSDALELGKQALEMQRELLGESHPDTINSLKFVADRLYASPLTASRGKALIEEFLTHIPRDHPSRAKVLDYLNAPRKGFRAHGKTVNKHKKR